jgi:dihydrofolate reductase
MLAADPPDLTRLRRLVAAAFTVRRIEALRPRMEQITDDLLDAMAGRDRLDLIDAFAFPLPVQVICELLGVPAGDRDDFRAWSNAIVGGVPFRDRLPGAMQAMVSYIRALIADRRAHGGDDLLTGLIEVRDRADRLSEDELSSMVFLLLVAGHETTVNLIGNGVLLLLSRRERWERLRADPALLPTAIEEFLRYEGPVETATFRVTTEPVEIGGCPVPAGPGGAAVGEPRRGPLRGAGRRAPGPDPEPAPCVRPRHPLLPRRAAGPAGGADRLHQADGTPARPAARRRGARAELAARHSHARPAEPARGAERVAAGRTGYHTVMRDLVVTENITVDGVIAPMDGWFDPGMQDDELTAAAARHRRGADAVVLGRVTYEEFATYWPDRADDATGISAYLDAVPKYVFSSSLDRADWANTTILRDSPREELTALKRAPGGDIVVTGSASLVRSLLPTGLIDVFRLFVYPVVQGHGRRLFDALTAGLTRTDAQVFGNGVVLLEYRSGAGPG